MPESYHLNLQRKFSNPADYGEFSVVRLNNKLVTSLGGRNAWVCIKSAHGPGVFRMIRGIGAHERFPMNGIELDYDTSLTLEIPKGTSNAQGFYPCDLVVRPATRWETMKAHWQHPDPSYRFPLRISMVSFVLGVVGLVLGALSLV